MPVIKHKYVTNNISLICELSKIEVVFKNCSKLIMLKYKNNIYFRSNATTKN